MAVKTLTLTHLFTEKQVLGNPTILKKGAASRRTSDNCSCFKTLLKSLQFKGHRFKAMGLTPSAEELTLSRCPDKTSNAAVRCLLSPIALHFLFGLSSKLLSSKIHPPLTRRTRSNPLGSQSIYLISICHFTLRFNDTMLNFIC